MREVIGLGQLRSNACAYLARVLAGETIEVVRRGKLVARIVSAAGDRAAPTARFDLVAVPGSGGRIGLESLRTRAGHHFDRVAAGETIWIVWHGKLVARIESADDPRAALIGGRPSNVAARDGGRRIGLDELRTRAGHYFDRVAAGEMLEVVRAGQLVARIVSAGDPSGSA
jgi:antitoxin (DNA-binding transcriptional repressor) of toxin-antitoxin stability system